MYEAVGHKKMEKVPNTQKPRNIRTGNETTAK